MMADPRAKYFHRLRRLRASARRWSVATGALVGAAIVLLPYHGIAPTDAIWMAAAGGSGALTWWRWSDLRALAAQGAPPPLDPAFRAARTQARIEAVVGRLPIGRTAINEMHRFTHLSRLRGSVVAPAGARLDQAVKVLTGLAPRLTGPGADALIEARAAERALRDMAERIASVERALSLNATDGLVVAHAELLDRFTDGVGAYEIMVSAAAHYVAEDGRLSGPVPITGLTEASDRLRGIAIGLSDLRAADPAAW